MRKLILSLYVLISVTACAQRLQTRVKPISGSAIEKTFDTLDPKNGAVSGGIAKDISKEIKTDTVAVKTQSDVERDAKAILEEEAKRAADTPKEPKSAPITINDISTKPLPLTIPGTGAGDLPANCGVDFQPLPEFEAAKVIARFAGFWADEKTGINLGAKNEQIFISKILRNEAGEISGKEKRIQAASYLVSGDVKGFRLLSVMTSSANGEKVSCQVLGLRLEAGSDATKSRLLLILPKAAGSPEAFITGNQASARVLHLLQN